MVFEIGTHRCQLITHRERCRGECLIETQRDGRTQPRCSIKRVAVPDINAVKLRPQVGVRTITGLVLNQVEGTESEDTESVTIRQVLDNLRLVVPVIDFDLWSDQRYDCGRI